MDSTPSLDPMSLGILLLAYLALGLVWLRLAVRTRRD
jgi:hypothetical protein